MTVETASYISQLDTTLPTAADLISEGDDHIRLTKTVLKTQFPNFGTTAITASAAEVNYSVGVTSGIQGQINTKGAIAGQTWTGAHVYSDSIAVPTLTQGTSTTGAASTAFVQNEWSTRLPNYSAPITASSTELNYVAGVTSAIQTQLNTKGAISGQTWTGTHNFSGGSITVPTMGAADNSTNAASTAFVQSKAFATALPNQTGNAGKFVTTDGSVASWSSTIDGGLNFGGTGRRITGDFSNATLTNRVAFQTSVANGASVPYLLPNGTSQISGITAVGASDPTNAPYASMYFSGVNAVYEAGANGTGTQPNMVFNVGGAERLRIDTSGNVLVTGSGKLGYGIGSGGTVTQTTSKSTAVTLNKPAGRITLNNAALGSGTSVVFQVNNTSVAATDLVLAQIVWEAPAGDNYRLETMHVGAGAFALRLTNISAGSLSDALQINFVVIKGVTS